jgi:hypothetical protein
MMPSHVQDEASDEAAGIEEVEKEDEEVDDEDEDTESVGGTVPALQADSRTRVRAEVRVTVVLRIGK